jgi:hypothetical protein
MARLASAGPIIDRTLINAWHDSRVHAVTGTGQKEVLSAAPSWMCAPNCLR